MIILGVDPGFAITGYGIIESKDKGKNLKIINYGAIRTPKELLFNQRLSIIYHKFKKIIKKYKPDKIGVETLYFAKNVKTAMKVSEARGVIILTANLNNIPILEYTPLQVKQALIGYGRATKMQIQKMVKIIFNLKKIPKPDDAADALAIAVTCVQYNENLK